MKSIRFEVAFHSATKLETDLKTQDFTKRDCTCFIQVAFHCLYSQCIETQQDTEFHCGSSCLQWISAFPPPLCFSSCFLKRRLPLCPWASIDVSPSGGKKFWQQNNAVAFLFCFFKCPGKLWLTVATARPPFCFLSESKKVLGWQRKKRTRQRKNVTVQVIKIAIL